MCRLIEFLASQLGISRTQIIIIAILVLVFGILFPNIVIALFTVVIAAAMVLGLHEVYPRRPEIEKLEPTISNEMTFTIPKLNRSERTGRINLGFENMSKRITIRPKVQIRIPMELVPLNYLQSHEARGDYDRLQVTCKDPASWHVPCDPQSKEPTRGPLRSSVAGFAHYNLSDFPDAGYVDMFFEPPFVASEQEFRFWLRILLEEGGADKTILMIVSVPYFQREVSRVFTYTLPKGQ